MTFPKLKISTYTIPENQTGTATNLKNMTGHPSLLTSEAMGVLTFSDFLSSSTGCAGNKRMPGYHSL